MNNTGNDTQYNVEREENISANRLMQNLASTESQTIHRLLEMGGDMNNTGNYSNYDQVQDELYNETMAAEETAKEEEQRNMEETRNQVAGWINSPESFLERRAASNRSAAAFSAARTAKFGALLARRGRLVKSHERLMRKHDG